jgi:hypothetical protein
MFKISSVIMYLGFVVSVTWQPVMVCVIIQKHKNSQCNVAIPVGSKMMFLNPTVKMNGSTDLNDTLH